MVAAASTSDESIADIAAEAGFADPCGRSV